MRFQYGLDAGVRVAERRPVQLEQGCHYFPEHFALLLRHIISGRGFCSCDQVFHGDMQGLCDEDSGIGRRHCGARAKVAVQRRFWDARPCRKLFYCESLKIQFISQVLPESTDHTGYNSKISVSRRKNN